MTLLVLSPHPDDLELSCGLLCHKAILMGWRVCEIVLTDGAAGGNEPKIYHTEQLRQLRIEEAKSGARILGIEQIEFLGVEDSKLHLDLKFLSSVLLKKLESLSPEVIVFPSARDTHSDHSSTHLSATSALSRYHKTTHSLQYCFWGNDPQQNIVLSHVVGIKVKEGAIKKHKTQPIDRYFRRLYESDGVTNGNERYYSPDSNKTVSVMLDWGFNVQQI
ncbi:PIG-L family deacetylase [Patescibacteria group bacterium]|nr:PIG-L family deacetylase [Patescibacteria group bacterium]